MLVLAPPATSAPLPVHRDVMPTTEIRRLLAQLLVDESALYSILRDWRYDRASRKFVRLHALLDEQFTAVGRRLAKLAACSRAHDLPVSTGHGRAAPSRTAIDDSTLEGRIMRELLDRHEALLVRLRAGAATATIQFRDSAINPVLADLIADHEKDAFMLRALLWEVRNTAA
jgi:DNA-binding ferritin-like protein